MNMLLALSIAIAAGLAVSRLARLVRLPNVTAFLVGGLIIGPSVLGILPRICWTASPSLRKPRWASSPIPSVPNSR